MNNIGSLREKRADKTVGFKRILSRKSQESWKISWYCKESWDYWKNLTERFKNLQRSIWKWQEIHKKTPKNRKNPKYQRPKVSNDTIKSANNQKNLKETVIEDTHAPCPTDTIKSFRFENKKRK